MFTDAAVLMYWEEWKQLWSEYAQVAKQSSEAATGEATIDGAIAA